MFKQVIYPISNYSSNIKLGFSIVDQLKSCSYSNSINKTIFTREINKLIDIDSPVLIEVLYTSAIKASNQDLKIDLLDKISNYYPEIKQGIDGVCKDWGSLVLVSNNNTDSMNTNTFVHELTHATMLTVLSKLKATPYKSFDKKGEELFDQALRSTLLNVKNYLNNNCQMNIYCDEQNSTFDIGSKLVKALSPDNKVIEGERAVQELIDIVGNINAKFLDSQTILQSAVRFNKDDIIKFLLLNGAEIKGSGLLNYIIQLNKTELLEWIIDNQINIDVNETLDCDNNTSIIAHTPYLKMIKLLLKAGANFNDALSYLTSKNDLLMLYNIIQAKPILSPVELKTAKIAYQNIVSSETPEISLFFKKYIEDNDTWYNFFSMMFSLSNQKNNDTVSSKGRTEDTSKDQNLQEVLSKDLLSFFREAGDDGVYKVESMHVELIVTLPVIISQGIYHDEIEDIMKPIEEYWQEYITPAIEQYQIESDKSDFCLGADSHYSDNVFTL